MQLTRVSSVTLRVTQSFWNWLYDDDSSSTCSGSPAFRRRTGVSERKYVDRGLVTTDDPAQLEWIERQLSSIPGKRSGSSRTSTGSTAVSRVAYDGSAMALYVEFADSGGVYRYEHVPQMAYDALAEARSVGRYVNRTIKPHYACQKLSAWRAGVQPQVKRAGL
jgi:hypothetical protein